MAKKTDLDAAVAGGNQQGRKVVGGAGPSYSSAAPKSGTLVPKNNAKGGGDASMGTATHRAGVSQPVGERMGGAYRVVVSNGYAQPNAVEASATQANGRVLKSSLDRGRSYGTFNDGPTTGY